MCLLWALGSDLTTLLWIHTYLKFKTKLCCLSVCVFLCVGTIEQRKQVGRTKAWRACVNQYEACNSAMKKDFTILRVSIIMCWWVLTCGHKQINECSLRSVEILFVHCETVAGERSEVVGLVGLSSEWQQSIDTTIETVSQVKWRSQLQSNVVVNRCFHLLHLQTVVVFTQPHYSCFANSQNIETSRAGVMGYNTK